MAIDWELDALLSLNGEVHEVGGGLWFKIVAYKIKPTHRQPHGIEYCLTLHDQDNKRLFGIDNAHALKKPRKGPDYKRIMTFDHTHKGEKIKAYAYRSAAELLKDFFDFIDAEKKKRGIK
ncbi:MAG TPA: hypothetical protein ENI79_03365 [Rhodospirillales bacterium]|nr:hypothetical protein [Rhodospirillales bacterium]